MVIALRRLCFRFGGPLVGKLPLTGNGTAFSFPKPECVDDVWHSRLEANRELLEKLKEDKRSWFPMKQCTTDAKLHRMASPVPLCQQSDCNSRLAPGFCVEQGVKNDGSVKLRAIYDFFPGVRSMPAPSPPSVCITTT